MQLIYKEGVQTSQSDVENLNHPRNVEVYAYIWFSNLKYSRRINTSMQLVKNFSVLLFSIFELNIFKLDFLLIAYLLVIV